VAAYGVDRVVGVTDIRADGASPLAGNWDAGSFQIRSQSFRADSFVVESTTKVTNLNVSHLDGVPGRNVILSGSDHEFTVGKGDDDHVMYGLANGTRPWTANIVIDKTTPKLRFVPDASDTARFEFRNSADSADVFAIERDSSGSLNFKDSSGGRVISVDSSGDMWLMPNGGNVTMGGASTASGIFFYEPSGDGTNYFAGFYSYPISSNQVYTLPATAGSAGQALGVTDSNGSMGWLDLPTGLTLTNGTSKSLAGQSYVEWTGLALSESDMCTLSFHNVTASSGYFYAVVGATNPETTDYVVSVNGEAAVTNIPLVTSSTRPNGTSGLLKITGQRLSTYRYYTLTGWAADQSTASLHVSAGMKSCYNGQINLVRLVCSSGTFSGGTACLLYTA
jgi:hypothetical protein